MLCENIFSIQSGPNKLFAVAHEPRAPARGAAIVFCHPFGEEKKAAQFSLTLAARRFAGLGFGVLRFDLSGCGDSFGEFVDSTWAGWNDDVKAAAAFARRHFDVRRVGLLGLRLGANLAASVGGDFLIMWEPIESGSSFAKGIIRKKMMKEMIIHGKASTGASSVQTVLDAQGFIDADGWALSKGLFADLQQRNLAGELTESPIVFILQIRHTPSIAPSIEAVAKAIAARGASCDAAALRCPPFWDRIEIIEPTEVFDLTETWLEKLQPSTGAPAGEAPRG